MAIGLTFAGATRVVGVFGDPVEHSCSPQMHNAAFQAMGLDWVYLAFRVAHEHLHSAVKAVRALNMPGVNVTVPHKVAAVPLVDRLSREAEQTGAVNTMVNENGILTGHNTDVEGFLRCARGAGVTLGGQRVMVLGAGGAARAVVAGLAQVGAAQVVVANRSPHRAAEVAELGNRLAGHAFAGPCELTAEALKQADEGISVFIQTTSVGMYPDVGGALPLPWELVGPDTWVVDLVYNPPRTRLLALAEQRGARCVGGVEMLVQQGAASLELWSKREAPVPVMREALVAALEGVANGGG